MNKEFVKNILGVLLFSMAILYSGCGPLTVASVQTSATPVSTIPTATVTPIPCAYPHEPTSELQKIAETWFLSDIPQIPDRSQYKLFNAGEEWGFICKQYQYLLSINEQLASNPIEISLRVITRSLGGKNYFGMNTVIVSAVNSEDWLTSKDLSFSSPKNKNIMTVVVTFPYTNNLVESRADYVFENDLWQFRWLGIRWKCLNDKESDWNIQEPGDCPK